LIVLRRTSWVTWAALPIVLALVGNLATNVVQLTRWWEKVAAWAVLATLVAASIVTEGRKRRFVRLTVDQAVKDLSISVAAQWSQEQEQRKVDDPVALPVRWHQAPEQLHDHWANIHRLPAGQSRGPLPVSGKVDSIVEIYCRIPSGRLVILGSAGSGKTGRIQVIMATLRSLPNR
jgi:hypothetical protein